MRVAIISGGRDYEPTTADLSALDATLKLHEITHVIHGADPVDMVCHRRLKENGRARLGAFPTCIDGVDARNTLLADVAQAMTDYGCWQPARRPLWILFAKGKGTSNAAGLAEHGPYEVVRIGGES
jgi:hypothetical protein